MVRFLIWVLLFYVVWRMIRSISRPSVPPSRGNNRARGRPTGDRFADVEEADFEDVTPKKPSQTDSTTHQSS